jgi:hypothetical protein
MIGAESTAVEICTRLRINCGLRFSCPRIDHFALEQFVLALLGADRWVSRIGRVHCVNAEGNVCGLILQRLGLQYANKGHVVGHLWLPRGKRTRQYIAAWLQM